MKQRKPPLQRIAISQAPSTTEEQYHQRILSSALRWGTARLTVGPEQHLHMLQQALKDGIYASKAKLLFPATLWLVE